MLLIVSLKVRTTIHMFSGYFNVLTIARDSTTDGMTECGVTVCKYSKKHFHKCWIVISASCDVNVYCRVCVFFVCVCIWACMCIKSLHCIQIVYVKSILVFKQTQNYNEMTLITLNLYIIYLLKGQHDTINKSFFSKL